MTASLIFRSDILASEALSIMNNKSITILPVNDHMVKV